MAITPVGTGGTYSCQCGTAVTPGTSRTCAANVPVLYGNVGGTASLAARRRRMAAIAGRAAQESEVCPGSLSSCLVNVPTVHSGVSFECIDTQAELESCGGCVNGYYSRQFVIGQNITFSGVDCTSMEGVTFGAVSCVSGQCVASRCRSGYRLVNLMCERDATLPTQRQAATIFKRSPMF